MEGIARGKNRGGRQNLDLIEEGEEREHTKNTENSPMKENNFIQKTSIIVLQVSLL